VFGGALQLIGATVEHVVKQLSSLLLTSAAKAKRSTMKIGISWAPDSSPHLLLELWNLEISGLDRKPSLKSGPL